MKTKDQKTPKSKEKSNEIPKKEKPAHKRSDAVDELQHDEHQSSTADSYSEIQDLTPPTPHGFPKVGIAETDFRPSDHGRRAGSMIDHEPGI
ncbi:MAG: hypothetical protein ABIX36_04515 [Mucilaginibacter sp.]|uniref:hypothetical protein n=1 Tax=Mucilaginibacter sp. TaxID=1882438 RepID=UPI003263397F